MKKSAFRIGSAHRAGALLLALAGAGCGTALAAPMPLDSHAWMVFTGNSCGPSGVCATSNTPGPNPPNGIPTSTFIGSGGPIQTGSAEILPDRMRSFNSGYGGSHMYVSMFDTYTVHGAATGPFDITVHLSVDGFARAIYLFGTYGLQSGAVEIEIGTWDPTTEDLDERSRVTQFDDSSAAMYLTPTYSGGSPFETALAVAASHSRMVSAGDVFDIAYNVSTDMAWGELDLLNTATIGFDLPDGIWLTSQNGAIFGTPVPEPSTPMLLAAGLILVCLARRAERRG